MSRGFYEGRVLGAQDRSHKTTERIVRSMEKRVGSR